MSEQEQYHPAVERTMETSGRDIGRVKDVDVAHKLATEEGSVERNNRSEVVRSAVEHGDPDTHLAEASYDKLEEAAHHARIEAARNTFHAVDVPEPPEVSSAERSEAEKAADMFIVRARGYMSDEQKDALETHHDEDRFNFALTRALEVLDTDPTAPIRDDLTDLIAMRYETSPREDRFLKNPIDGGVLMTDTAADLVSMQGAQISTIAPGVEGAGEQYIADYMAVAVLTGPNKGKSYARQTYPTVVPRRRHLE